MSTLESAEFRCHLLVGFFAAFRNVLDAIESWESVVEEEGKAPPEPDSFLAMMQFHLPPHLKPQIDELVRQMEASHSEPVSRDQIIAGIMLQLVRGQGSAGAPRH